MRKQEQESKPQLTREDMAAIGRIYLTLSDYLDKDPKPVIITGLRTDDRSKRIHPEIDPARTPLSLWDILKELRSKNLRGKSNETSRKNVALATYLGGTALLELFEQTENIRLLPAGFTTPISRATGDIQRNIDYAMDGTVADNIARDLVKESSGLVNSLRFTQPGKV